MPGIAINSLTKIYPPATVALQDVSFNVAEGDFFALLGPNGAGKSTTINILISLIKKTKGKITVFGVDIDKDINRVKSFIGVVPQEFNFNIFESCFDILIYQAGYHGVPVAKAKTTARELLTRLELWDKRNTPAGKLSGGMKRRLMIARALIHQPKLLILDEPTAGVDVEIRKSMWAFLQYLNRQGTTIILTTHYLEEAEQLCRNIAIINKGKVITNTTMKSLLASLECKRYRIQLSAPITTDQLPIAPDLEFALLEPDILTVSVLAKQPVSYLFQCLQAHHLVALDISSEQNKLETLFLKLIAEDKPCS